MNISRFFGATNREALRQVRLALGSDALIVSNKRINGGVEILAADQTLVFAQDAPPANDNAIPNPDVMGAIGAMRGALETRIDELLWGNQLKRVPQAVALFQSLLGYGFSTALLRAMLQRLPQGLSARAAFQWARDELVAHLPVLRSEDQLWKAGMVVALVGPTGVGKTTTIAKLAARCIKRFGVENVVLLTTDTYRVGAHEQLKIYGQIMRLPVHVVQDAGELRRIVAGISPDQTILIDNVGISQRDQYISEQADMLARAGRAVSRILVLNASSQGDTLDEVARRYSNDGGPPLCGCIITKVDEAARLGAALDTAIRYQLPISYVSNGQKVPENLLFWNAVELVDQALEQRQQSQALYAPTEADFAALMSLAKGTEMSAANAAAEARYQQLLPHLLSVVGQANTLLSMSDLKNVCAYLDEDLACLEGYGLWRDYTDLNTVWPSLSASLSHLVRAAQNEVGHVGHGYLLAVHGHIGLRREGQAAGNLRATLLLSDRGIPLVSPLQQLAFADGWQSSAGLSALRAPSISDALLQQINWLEQHERNLPLVHLLDGVSQAFLRALLAQDVSWLAQSSAGTKVEVQSCQTTLGALAKALDYRSVDQVAGLLQLGEVGGRAIDDVVVWVGSQVVQLTARQREPMEAQMVSVRIVSRYDGALVKQLYGLANLSIKQATPDVLAAWLIVQAESKSSFRYAACHWSLLNAGDRPDSLQRRALTAMQMGLVAWRLLQASDTNEVRAIIRALIGGKAALTAPAVALAVLKLFGLKQLMA